MDILGDIGSEDQLTSTRAENKVLNEKVKELTERVKVLTVENAALLAEVEMYRKEAALPNFSKLALGQSSDNNMDTDDNVVVSDDFVRSGNGVFPSEAAVTLQNLHGSANPLCCSLNDNDTIVASGGADSNLVLCQWGAALAPSPDAAAKVVQSAVRIPFSAPVICVGFAGTENLVAGGCMDGSVKVFAFSAVGQGLEMTPVDGIAMKHTKYVKDMAWSPTEPILATASADGNIIISKASQESMETITTLHLPGTVECLCFSRDGTTLFCYARDTPYMSCFNLFKDFEQTKVNLNGGSANGGFEDHVSFAVMDMAVSPDGKYIALATDVSRNIIMEIATGKQVRNLYGHMNDEFSQPKVAWSFNGQYILGNTQDDGCVCVWDIASSAIVKRLEGHSNPVRSLYSSPRSDTLVTTSFDKMTKIWLTPV